MNGWNAGRVRVTPSSNGHGFTIAKLQEYSEVDANHVQQLKDEAKRQWAKPGHPGWSIIGAVGQEEQVCALSHVSVPHASRKPYTAS